MPKHGASLARRLRFTKKAFVQMLQSSLLKPSRLILSLAAMIGAPKAGVAHMANMPLGGCDLAEVEAEKKVDEARNLLESVVLLETVAVERESKAENIVESLTDDGMKPEEVAERLDIPDAAVHTMLERDQPKLPHERMGVSEETVARLDPFKVREA